MPQDQDHLDGRDHFAVRAVRPSDLSFFRALAQDERVTQYVGNGEAWTDEFVQQRFDDALAGGEMPDRQVRWYIAETSPQVQIGLLALTLRPRETEIGYWISPDHWGNGYGSSLMERALGIAGGMRPQLPITATVHRNNLASRRIVERALFRVEEPHGADSPDELTYWHGPLTI